MVASSGFADRRNGTGMTGGVQEVIAAALHLTAGADLIQGAVDFGLNLGADASALALFDRTLS
jgi:hypothetical protein